jgi:hypothetical protein
MTDAQRHHLNNCVRKQRTLEQTSGRSEASQSILLHQSAFCLPKNVNLASQAFYRRPSPPPPPSNLIIDLYISLAFICALRSSRVIQPSELRTNYMDYQTHF